MHATFLKRKAADIAWLRGMQHDIVRAPESWSAIEGKWLKLVGTGEKGLSRLGVAGKWAVNGRLRPMELLLTGTVGCSGHGGE